MHEEAGLVDLLDELVAVAAEVMTFQDRSFIAAEREMMGNRKN